MAREVFGTPWVKLEVIGEADTLQPDRSASSRRRGTLPPTVSRFFCIRPSISSSPTTDRAGRKGADAVGRADRLRQGAQQRFGVRASARRSPRCSLIVDAGIGLAVACRGGDGARLRRRAVNTAVAKAGDPVAMARASVRRSRRAAPRSWPGIHSRATWRRPRRPSLAGRADVSVLDLPASLPGGEDRSIRSLWLSTPTGCGC